MSLTEECAKHEMIGCQVCNPRPVPEPLLDSRAFLARYDGQCPECNLPIHAGKQLIVLRGDVDTCRAIHEACR